MTSAAPRVEHRTGPPYRLPPLTPCQLCGLPASAFWPGAYVEHQDGTACVVASRSRLQLSPVTRTGVA